MIMGTSEKDMDTIESRVRSKLIEYEKYKSIAMEERNLNALYKYSLVAKVLKNILQP